MSIGGKNKDNSSKAFPWTFLYYVLCYSQPSEYIEPNIIMRVLISWRDRKMNEKDLKMLRGWPWRWSLEAGKGSETDSPLQSPERTPLLPTLTQSSETQVGFLTPEQLDNELCYLKPLTCACVFGHVPLFATPWTVACQASLSLEFSRQEYWSKLSFVPPGHLPDPGTELTSLVAIALAGRFLTTVTHIGELKPLNH